MTSGWRVQSATIVGGLWALVGPWASVALRAESTTRDALIPAPTLATARAEEVRASFTQWLDSQAVAAPRRERSLARLADLPISDARVADGNELIWRLGSATAEVDDRAARLLEICSQPHAGKPLPNVAWLQTDELPPLVRNNLRLIYGRWLAQQRLYDEALGQLGELDPRDVVDPATLLFFQAVVDHRLLHRERGLKAIDRLLTDTTALPSRYKTVASLMRADLAALEEDTLDHIARRMDDIRRRLDLGRAGAQTRQVEDGVIKSLDKLIDEMEKQQQQQQAAAAFSPGGGSQPMQQPQLAPAQGPGKTDRRNIGNTSGWGDLPPKEREAALQQIGKDLPAHYREVIEQYFRRLATEGSRAAVER